MTLQEVEAALANGQLFAKVYVNAGFGPVKCWQMRRNGATKRWARQPERFRIPFKVGLRQCGYITNENVGDFVFAADRESAEMALRLLRCGRTA